MTVTPGSAGSRLESLERELARLRALVDAAGGRTAVRAAPLVYTLAKTFKTGQWPAPPANAFDVRFLDIELDTWSPGTRTVTTTPRSASAQAVAATFDGRYLLPDKVVELARFNRRWWVVGYEGLEYFGRLQGDLAKGGSATIDILEPDGTDTGYDLTVWDRFLNSDTTLLANTKVKARLEAQKYWVENAFCKADDTE